MEGKPEPGAAVTATAPTAPEDIKTGLAAYARRVKGHDWKAIEALVKGGR